MPSVEPVHRKLRIIFMSEYRGIFEMQYYKGWARLTPMRGPHTVYCEVYSDSAAAVHRERAHNLATAFYVTVGVLHKYSGYDWRP